MASPSFNLATSLERLKSLQDAGRMALTAADLTRTHRERLLKAGFLREVMKGWYVPSRPDEPTGESTAWYTAFWPFAAEYLERRFDDQWCLSPEQSLRLHTGDRTVPWQLLVRSPRGGNKPIRLLHDVSIFDARLALPPVADRTANDGLRLMTLPAALIATAPGHYTSQAAVMRTSLGMMPNAADLLRRLLEGGHSKVAGRLAGALRNIGRSRLADEILATMRAAGYTVLETDPFAEASIVSFDTRETSPYVGRLRIMWATMREPVLRVFPPPPGTPADKAAYLQNVEDRYLSDAYHSLSIEGYQVNATLIERVRTGGWNPDANEQDRQNRNALAARGYWQAFQAVKRSLIPALDGQHPGLIADRELASWYRELFGPSVTAGLLKPADLAGYREGPVYIRRSMHVPPNHEAVRELMPEFFALLSQEPEPAVRVVLGHFILAYIHPYFDGNGRMARFLMNLMFAAGGWPWTIIPVSARDEYMAVLESASVRQDIEPFARFIATRVTDAAAGRVPAL